MSGSTDVSHVCDCALIIVGKEEVESKSSERRGILDVVIDDEEDDDEDDIIICCLYISFETLAQRRVKVKI